MSRERKIEAFLANMVKQYTPDEMYHNRVTMLIRTFTYPKVSDAQFDDLVNNLANTYHNRAQTRDFERQRDIWQERMDDEPNHLKKGPYLLAYQEAVAELAKLTHQQSELTVELCDLLKKVSF